MKSIVTSKDPRQSDPQPAVPSGRSLQRSARAGHARPAICPAAASKAETLPEANAFLTQIVDYAADDKPVPPPLVLGALIGLERHAQLREGLPPEAVAAMTAAMVKLVSHEKPIQEMDPDAYAWIRFRAAEALAKMGGVGDKNSVHNAIVKLVASSKSLDDRCKAAGILDKITYKDVKAR